MRKIRNAGGDASFELSAPNGQVVDGKLHSDKFIIEPSSFKLKKGEELGLKVQYCSSEQEGSSKCNVKISSEYLLNREFNFTVLGSSFKPHISLVGLSGSRNI